MAEPNSILMALALQQAKSLNSSPFSQAVNSDIKRNANAVANALMAPGNALRGEYSQTEIEPSGYVRPFSSGLMGAASNMAGVVSLGSVPIPRPLGSLGIGGTPRIPQPLPSSTPKPLPFSESLNLPPVPSPEIMARFSRVEKVPLAQVRATNGTQWDRFNSGQHPPELVKGFGSKPVAVRKENGEYLIYDGHHRTALAASKGQNSLDMYVVDAKDYAPYAAGKKPAPQSMSDDDILRALGL